MHVSGGVRLITLPSHGVAILGMIVRPMMVVVGHGLTLMVVTAGMTIIPLATVVHGGPIQLAAVMILLNPTRNGAVSRVAFQDCHRRQSS